MMTESNLSRPERRFLTVILAGIVVLVGVDLLTDSQEGVQWPHLVVELSVALGAAAGIFLLMKDSIRKSHELVQSRELIVTKEIEAERWRIESQKYIQGLGIAIDAQLARWSLSPSEKEVALLLLKGLSLKEIADIRNTAEKTVRAQSVAIYSKSGLAGRSELSAFFLEDLLLPSKVSESESPRT
jgi:DNA-binding CsgD family transcriptional regulator